MQTTDTQPIAPLLLLALVTAVQLLATFAVLAVPTLAPAAAETFGVRTETVGFQLSLIYVAASSVSSFAGLWVRRWGAVTVSIAAMVATAIGLAGLASASVPLAVASSLAIGAGYALTNPAASQLLLRHGPRDRQNLVFAIKQTGVPLGAMLAALMLPRLAGHVGWQGAMLASTTFFALMAAALLPYRAAIDHDADPGARVHGGLLAGARLAMTHPTLRSLAIMGGCYASSQFCLLSFMVTMLVADLGWSLVAAGSIVAAMQVGGVLGRVGWSLIADWTGRGIEILIAIGVLAALLALTTGLLTPGWPLPLLVLLLMTFAFCLVGWNGVYMAEVARAVPQSEVGIATGGVLVFNFAGVMVGPTAFALVSCALGSYALSYAVLAILPLIGAAALTVILLARRRAGDDATR